MKINLENFLTRKDLPVCEHILKTESDESKRWDAVWLLGEILEKELVMTHYL